MKFKNYFYLLFFLFFFRCTNNVKKKQEEAILFNQRLVDFSEPVNMDMNELFNRTTGLMNNAIQANLSQSDIEQTDEYFKNLILKISSNTDSINILVEFDNEIRLKAAGLNYLSVCRSTLNKEFKELFKAIQNKMTRENIINSGELVLVIWEKLIELEKNGRQIENDFAKKYAIDKKKHPQNWKMIEEQFNAYKLQFEIMKTGITSAIPPL